MKQEIGDLFQQETKYSRERVPAGYPKWKTRPDTYKTYPEARRIRLPAPLRSGGGALWEVIFRRRSVRNFLSRSLEKGHLSQLLWAAQGITQNIVGYDLRAAPSAGALYPIETYLIVHNVQDIDAGVYHYAVREHSLELLRSGDFRAAIVQAGLEQDFLDAAAAVFAWTAVFERSKWKYGQRAYRYIYLDAGHIAENLALAAVSLNLGSCQVAALYDDEVNSILGVDGREESSLFLTAVGHPE
jgi:SagB-type dehydrogenase family enzyme